MIILSVLGSTSPSSADSAFTASASAGSASASCAPVLSAAQEAVRAEEQALIERCCSGDVGAFDVVVKRHQDRIFNLCAYMLGDRDEAADAAQDTFVRAFGAIKNFRAQAALGTWLHRIAVNVCLDARARRARAPISYSALETPNDEGQTQAFDPPDSADTPSQALTRRERRTAVLEALASLAEHHRTVIAMFDIQGYSYEDAAEALDLPMGTLKSRLNRARAALRTALEPQRELFED